MDEEEIIQLEDNEIKYEVLSSDDEYGFQFEVTDKDYESIIKDLKAQDSDVDEADAEIKIDCPHDGCKKSFSRRHNLLKHLRTHEMGIDQKGSICHICGKFIKGVYSLHLKIHESSKQYRCDECGRCFRQKVALNNHLLIHRNEKPHECPFCYKRFRQKYTMQHHMKNRHTGVKDHICELCGKEFSDRPTLQKHALVHSTNKPHQCSTCFMSFRHKSSLSRHNKIHLKVTQCQHCNRCFRYESFLKKHLQTAHKNTVSLIEIPKEDIKHEECLNIISYEDHEGSQTSFPVETGSTLVIDQQYYSSQPMIIEQTYSS